jgi:hypothetical protein
LFFKYRKKAISLSLLKIYKKCLNLFVNYSSRGSKIIYNFGAHVKTSCTALYNELKAAPAPGRPETTYTELEFSKIVLILIFLNYQHSL